MKPEGLSPSLQGGQSLVPRIVQNRKVYIRVGTMATLCSAFSSSALWTNGSTKRTEMLAKSLVSRNDGPSGWSLIPICTYPEPDESSQCPPNWFFRKNFDIILPSMSNLPRPSVTKILVLLWFKKARLSGKVVFLLKCSRRSMASLSIHQSKCTNKLPTCSKVLFQNW